MNEPHLPDKTRCTGCELCAAICPKQAIRMAPDALGFVFPRVSKRACVGCGLCESRCPVLRPPTGKPLSETPMLLAARRDPQALLTSASGGVSAALAEATLRAGGVVFGVAYSADFRAARYAEAGTPEDALAFRSSKYVQAEKGGVYARVKERLDAGTPVLFVGLPCECAALRAFLGGDRDGLTVCDLICYGATTPRSLSTFVKELELRHGARVTALNMRHKRDAAGKAGVFLRAAFANGDVYLHKLYGTRFGRLFSRVSRQSCAVCPFKDGARASDLTLGDYVRMPETHPKYSPDGVSVVFARTEKGRALLAGAGDLLWCEGADGDRADVLERNPYAVKPVRPETPTSQDRSLRRELRFPQGMWLRARLARIYHRSK